MKVQAITSANLINNNLGEMRAKKVNSAHSNPIHQQNPNIISFKGGNPNHVILVGAETKGLQAVGGVATVVNDYFGMEGKEFAGMFPLNNAQVMHDATGVDFDKLENGRVNVSVHQFPADFEDESLRGKTFWTGADLDSTPIEEVRKNPGKYVLIDKVEEKVAPWDSNEKISLYKVHEKGKINGVKADIFLVANDTLGIMRQPYDTAAGGYSSKTIQELSNLGSAASEYRPSEYALFSRIVPEFKDAVIANTVTLDGSKFNPASMSLSDSQTSLVPYYMKQKGQTDISPFWTLHNGNPGYTGETSGRQLFSDLLLAFDEAEKNQVLDNLQANKDYQLAVFSGKEEEFFRKYIPELVDDNKCFNPALATLRMAFPTEESLAVDQHARGFVKGVNTVSKGYSEALAYNENLHSGVQSVWKELYKRGLAEGIMNALNDKSVSGFENEVKDGKVTQKRGYLPGYEASYTIKHPDGHEEVVSPFRRFQESFFKNADGAVNVTEDTLKHVNEVRLDNQINFFKRLQGVYDADGFQGEIHQTKGDKTTIIKGDKLRNLLINGLDGKNVELIGHISPEVVQQFEDAKSTGGKAPAVFVSWGRLDDQKALDQVMGAFDKFRQTHPDAILVAGGPAAYEKNGDLQACSKKTIAQAHDLARKHQGHFVFMNGFAPGKVLSGVADVAIFPSRFAPCELTDLENKKFLSRVIVSNCQGLADKNFDPEIEADKPFMDGYKTQSEFFGITKTDIENDATTRRIFHEGIPAENIDGYDKIYAGARKKYQNRLANSGTNYTDSLITTYKKILGEVVEKDKVAELQSTLDTLKLTGEESRKIKGLMTADMSSSQKEAIKSFSEGFKLSEKETQLITPIINGSTLTDIEKTRINNLLNGSTQSSVEDILLKTIFNKSNLADKNIALQGEITDAHLNVLKEYLNNVKQPTRKGIETQFINTGMVDETQLTAAKRLFKLDLIHNFIETEGKAKFAYDRLFVRCKNEKMENEIVNCMERSVNETTENRVNMLKNQYILNTSWSNNERLTKLIREGQPASSQYLYDEMMKSSSGAKEAEGTSGNFLKRLLDFIKPKNTPRSTTPASVAEQATEAAQDAVKSSSGMSKGAKIAIGIGAAVVALGGIYFGTHKSGDTKTNSQGDTFKPSNPSAKTNSPSAKKSQQVGNQYWAK